MQLVILAAGMGTRLGALTRDIPKCFIEVLGETLLERALRVVTTAADLNRIVLVVGYKKELFRELIGSSYKGVPVSYVENDVYDQTNNIYSLYLASDLLTEDDTILVESDLVFEPDVIEKTLRNTAPCSVVVDHYCSWMDGTVVKLTPEGHIKAFLRREEFSFYEVSQYYKTVNIYKLTKDFSQRLFVPYMGTYISSNGRNEYYESVFRLLVTVRPQAFSAVVLSGDKWEDLWYEVDDILDLDVAEALFSHDLTSLIQRDGGLWRFPRVWDFTTRKNPFFPPKEMQEEIAAYLGDYIKGKPSSMRVQRLLLSKYLNISSEYIQIYQGESSSLLEALRGTSSDLISYYCYVDLDLPSTCSPTVLSTGERLDLGSEGSSLVIVDESSSDLFLYAQTYIEEYTIRSHSNLVVIKDLGAILGIKEGSWFVVVSSNERVHTEVYAANSHRRLSSLTEASLQIVGRYKKALKQSITQTQIETQAFVKDLEELPIFEQVEYCGFYARCRLIPSWQGQGEILRSRLYQEYQILFPEVNITYIDVFIQSPEANQYLLSGLREISTNK